MRTLQGKHIKSTLQKARRRERRHFDDEEKEIYQNKRERRRKARKRQKIKSGIILHMKDSIPAIPVKEKVEDTPQKRFFSLTARLKSILGKWK